MSQIDPKTKGIDSAVKVGGARHVPGSHHVPKQTSAAEKEEASSLQEVNNNNKQPEVTTRTMAELQKELTPQQVAALAVQHEHVKVAKQELEHDKSESKSIPSTYNPPAPTKEMRPKQHLQKQNIRINQPPTGFKSGH